jgi:hypothetical protein
MSDELETIRGVGRLAASASARQNMNARSIHAPPITSRVVIIIRYQLFQSQTTASWPPVNSIVAPGFARLDRSKVGEVALWLPLPPEGMRSLGLAFGGGQGGSRAFRSRLLHALCGGTEFPESPSRVRMLPHSILRRARRFACNSRLAVLEGSCSAAAAGASALPGSILGGSTLSAVTLSASFTGC